MKQQAIEMPVNSPSELPTSFEKVVKELKLAPEEYAKSLILRDWVSRNKNEKYVPSDLLKTFGFEVNSDVLDLQLPEVLRHVGRTCPTFFETSSTFEQAVEDGPDMQSCAVYRWEVCI